MSASLARSAQRAASCSRRRASAGMVIGGLQEALDRRSNGRRVSQFVVVPAAAGLAVGGELFRRWRARVTTSRRATTASSRSPSHSQ